MRHVMPGVAKHLPRVKSDAVAVNSGEAGLLETIPSYRMAFPAVGCLLRRFGLIASRMSNCESSSCSGSRSRGSHA